MPETCEYEYAYEYEYEHEYEHDRLVHLQPGGCTFCWYSVSTLPGGSYSQT